MSEPVAPEKPDFIEKIADYAGWILAVSVAVIIAAWSLYFFQFRGSLSDDTAIWGQFGDFVGGTLNSVFAFFSFMILLSSLRLQLKELRLTREELEATRKELAASSAAQKMQAEHFDSEAKKKDHADAINYIISDIDFNTSKLNLKSLPNETGRIQITTPSQPDYPEPNNFDWKLYLPNSYDELYEAIENLRSLDYHCSILYKIYPIAPVLRIISDKFSGHAINLERKGWIADMKFFGKSKPDLK